MPAPRKYPSELRVRAIRLVREAREQYPELPLNAAVNRPRLGIKPNCAEDLALAEDVARRAAVAIGNAALHTETLEGRRGSSGLCCR